MARKSNVGTKKDPLAYSRWARDKVQPVNKGRSSNAGGGMSKGRGNIGSVSQLARQASHGTTTSSGMARKLNSGTSKTGAQPFPSMAKGPLRGGTQG
jgi:hypothetical protein